MAIAEYELTSPVDKQTAKRNIEGSLRLAIGRISGQGAVREVFESIQSRDFQLGEELLGQLITYTRLPEDVARHFAVRSLQDGLAYTGRAGIDLNEQLRSKAEDVIRERGEAAKDYFNNALRRISR